MEPRKNLNAVFLGIGEFSFCSGATSRAETRARGFRDIGNIMAFTPEIINTKEEHEGSYRTGKRVDKVFSTQQKVEYVIRSDEFNAGNIQMLLMAADADTNNAAGALAAEAGGEIEFTAAIPSVSRRWYDLYDASDIRRTNITSVVIAASPAVAATADSLTDTFTSAAHGLADGDPVFLQADTMPTGLTAGTVYYVIASAANTFQLATTVGGAAVDFTTDGVGVTWLPALVEDTDFEVDTRLGRVRFLTEQTATVYPYLTAPAITSADEAYMLGMSPMQSPTFEGYGRLVLFDPEQEDKVMLDHRDFSCTVVAERSGEITGKTPAEITLRVTVTGDEGVVFHANSLSQS